MSYLFRDLKFLLFQVKWGCQSKHSITILVALVDSRVHQSDIEQLSLFKLPL